MPNMYLLEYNLGITEEELYALLECDPWFQAREESDLDETR